MLKIEREQEILNTLQSAGYSTVRQLSQTLYISESTVRRVLTELEKKGQIKRSYGGAELLESHTHAPTFSARTHHNAQAKRDIARKAADLVEDGCIVFLDQSSTSFYLALALLSKHTLTVMTNNTEILSLLAQTDFTVLSSGGRLCESNRMCLVDAEAERSFSGVYADLAFFSTKSLSADGVITDCNREEISVRDAMLRNAGKKVFLCDSEKFDTRSGYRQCSLAQIDCLVSEGSTAQKYRKQFPQLVIL